MASEMAQFQITVRFKGKPCDSVAELGWRERNRADPGTRGSCVGSLAGHSSEGYTWGGEQPRDKGVEISGTKRPLRTLNS